MIVEPDRKQFTKLLEIAKSASLKAYSPYSKIKVGAALLTTNNEIFEGCNVENASYGLAICAERTAIFNAVSSGYNNFSAIAVFSPNINEISPCGACRQVISEFGRDITIVMGSNKKRN